MDFYVYVLFQSFDENEAGRAALLLYRPTVVIRRLHSL
jgi:hypothetical protein